MGLLDTLISQILDEPDAWETRPHHPVNNVPDTLLLPPGTPVFCDLIFGAAEHTGIWVGDSIVHLDGAGVIIRTAPDEFLARLDGMNPAVDIFYPATGPSQPLACPKAARRALRQVDSPHHYHLLFDNCHGFTIECLTDAKLPGTVSLRTVEMAISYVCKAQRWHWRRWRWQQAQLR